jgi:hypothetical protein
MEVLYIPCAAVQYTATRVTLLVAHSPQGKLPKITQYLVLLLLRHMFTSRTVASFVGGRSNKREGGEGKKLKGDERSIGQEEKSEGAPGCLGTG